MSKDLKPKQRLGQARVSTRKRILVWSLVAAAGIAGAYAAFRYTGSTEVDVAVARVRRGDFVVSVQNARGDPQRAQRAAAGAAGAGSAHRQAG